MAIYAIRGGQSYDIASPADVRQEIARALEENRRQRAEADNMKRMEVMVPVQPAATSAFISQTNFIGTPDQGYVWSVKLVTATLSAAGTFAAFKASTSGDTRRLLSVTTGITVGALTLAELNWGSDQGHLKHGEGLYLLSSVNISTVYVTAEQVTAEKAYKVYD